LAIYQLVQDFATIHRISWDGSLTNGHVIIGPRGENTFQASC
jgi:hypothetical protein